MKRKSPGNFVHPPDLIKQFIKANRPSCTAQWSWHQRCLSIKTPTPFQSFKWVTGFDEMTPDSAFDEERW